MQHARRGEDDHGPGIVGVTPVKGLDVLEFEHVALDESVFDLLIGPRDEHLIEIVGLFCQAQREVNGRREIHALPIGLQQDAEFLGTAESEDGDQHWKKAGNLSR